MSLTKFLKDSWAGNDKFSMQRFASHCLIFLFLSGPVRGATLEYSSYFGGADVDGANAVAVDSSGNIYMAGVTSSKNFPTVNAFQPSLNGGSDAFVAKFDPSGQLLFSTCFGGVGDEIINAIKLDPEGNIVVVGGTHSVDLPTTEDAFQPSYNGGTAFGFGDGFIARLTSDGSQLLYCSYFGGSGDEQIYDLAIDSAGDVCITGWTESSKNFPLKNPLQATFLAQQEEGFVAKFDPSLSHLVFSTYLGGEFRENSQRIAVDTAGFIYVSGLTASTNFPVTAGAFQTKHGFDSNFEPNWDGFVSKLKPDGSALVYSTYFGGPKGDGILALAVDDVGSVYMTGSSGSVWSASQFPLGFQPKLADGADAWVGKLNPEGSKLEWFSYLGGTSDNEWGFSIVVDKQRDLYVSGMTYATDFPLRDAMQVKSGGDRDTFIAKISADGRKLIYSTYLGASSGDAGCALALEPDGTLIGVGQTSSLDFPVRNAIQPKNASTDIMQDPADAFIARITPAILGPTLQIAPSGKNALISWPKSFADFTLESTTSPARSSWSKVQTAPLTFGDRLVVVQRSSSGSQYFRLRRL
jgi:hypothetical protein